MDLQFHGANCVSLSGKKIRLVIDDNLAELGSKTVAKNDDVLLFTGLHGLPAVRPKLVIDGPGEYEVGGLSIVGIAARSHLDADGAPLAVTIYKIMSDDATYVVTGHIYPALSEEQLEAIGASTDILVVPVGGNGYTLDPAGALQIIKKVEPKIVVPTHYADDSLHYPVPQQPLEEALKGLGTEPKEITTKYRFKRQDVSDAMQLIVLERS